MQEINVALLLQKYSVEIIVCAVIACFGSVLLYKIKNISEKALIILSFSIGTALYLAYGVIRASGFAASMIANASAAGALGVTLTVIAAKTLRGKNNDLKAALREIISGLTSDGETESAVDAILKIIADKPDVREEELKSLVSQILSSDAGDDEIELVVELLLSATGYARQSSPSDDKKEGGR